MIVALAAFGEGGRVSEQKIFLQRRDGAGQRDVSLLEEEWTRGHGYGECYCSVL